MMASESVQARIDRLLNEAREAVAESNWAVVLNHAQNVLRIETENEDARTYLVAAEGAWACSPYRQISPTKKRRNYWVISLLPLAFQW